MLRVRLSGDAAQFALCNGSVSFCGERKGQQLFLNIRREIQQMDHLADARNRNVAGQLEFGVTAHHAVARHFIGPGPEHEPADSWNAAVQQGLGRRPLRDGDAERNSSTRDADALNR